MKTKPSKASELAALIRPHISKLGYTASEAFDGLDPNAPEFVMCTLSREGAAMFNSAGKKFSDKKHAWADRFNLAVEEIKKHTGCRVMKSGAATIYVYP